MNATLLGTPIARLPKRCRPQAGQLAYTSVLQGPSTAQVDVQANGIIRWIRGSRQGAFVSLDGISFIRQNASLSNHADLFQGWNNLNHPLMANATWRQIGSMCILTGNIALFEDKAESWVDTLLTVAPACRPENGSLTFLVNSGTFAAVRSAICSC